MLTVILRIHKHIQLLQVVEFKISLRQSWMDERLTFEYGDMRIMVLYGDNINRIWLPETYISNSWSTEVSHMGPAHIAFVHIRTTGQVTYTQR